MMVISKKIVYFAFLYKQQQKEFLEKYIDSDLDFTNLRAICTDGAPAVLGCRPAFQAELRNKFPMS